MYHTEISTECGFVHVALHCLYLMQGATSNSRVTLAERLLAGQAALKQEPTAEECGMGLAEPTGQAQNMTSAVSIQEDSLVRCCCPLRLVKR